MAFFPWHPEQVLDPPGPPPLLLTGTPARWVSSRGGVSASEAYEPAALFADGLGSRLEAEGIRQGKLAANVWLLSAIACLTEYPDAIPLLFCNHSVGLQETNKVRLFLKTAGKWRVLLIDDTLPAALRDKKPLVSHLARRRDAPREVWLSLLEKAFAVLAGGYPGLAGGHPAAALEALTGDPVHVFAYDDSKARWQQLECPTSLGAPPTAAAAAQPPPRVLAGMDGDALWARLRDALARGHFVAVGTEGVIQSGQEDRQAFAVLELHHVSDLKLACVRNPWGSFRWKGDWSEGSPCWDERPDVFAAVNPVLEGSTDFYICFEDLRAAFYQLYIVQRGAGRNSSVRYLTAAAFTEPADLARQAGAHVAATRAHLRELHGAASCVPRVRSLVQAAGAAAGASLVRVGLFANRCASAARKRAPAPAASPAEDASALGAGEVVGAPAGGGAAIGVPTPAVRAAIDRIRNYIAPGEGGTATGYSVWPVAPLSSYRPVTVLRAYLRGEAAPAAAEAAVEQPPAPGAATAAAAGAAEMGRRGGAEEPPTSP